MVIVDSSVWIDYLRGTDNAHTRWLDAAAAYESIGLTSIILCEVLQGVRAERVFDAFRRDLTRFRIYESPDADTAIAAARNFNTLRRQGHTVRKTVDCLIATFCIQQRLLLLHRDRDFDAFEMHLGLRVLHPPEELQQ